jgi:antitoxin (DNA-binding transcriptional repressor) of toxin-antitoxin stability system
MTSHDRPVPDLVPQLSRGKHRNPRKGACFMELASYLAGERWSDHPSCTHPLLATMARLVNDHTTDEGRDRLSRLVPSVIGLTSDDPRVDVEITLRAATTALPVAAADRQRILAVSVLAAERMLSRLDADRDARPLSERSRRALDQAPDADRWARSFTREIRTTPRGFYRYAAPNTVRQAVVGVSQACMSDPDALLHDMLAGAVADCERMTDGEVSTREPRVDEDAWAAACAITGVRSSAPPTAG